MRTVDRSGEGSPSFYDNNAHLYDYSRFIPRLQTARKAAVDSLELSPGDTVVDMGTGTGANLSYLVDAVGDAGTVVGIEVSEKMLERAQRRVDRHGWDNVSVVRGDAWSPPLDEPVDGIMSAFLLDMFDEPDELVEEWTAYIDDGAIANIYSSPSTRTGVPGAFYRPVVNTAYAGFTRLFDQGWQPSRDYDGVMRIIETRGERSRARLEQVADSVEQQEYLLGLIRIDTGYVRGRE